MSDAFMRFREVELADQTPEATPPPKSRLTPRFPLGRDRRPITERPWKVEKLAMVGEITLIVAPPGAGKTTLIQQVGYAGAAGRSWGGFPAPAAPLRVLFLHWEDDEDEMDRKLQAVELTLDYPIADPENILTVYCGAKDESGEDDDVIIASFDPKTGKTTTTPDFDTIVRLIESYHPDIVVADPVAPSFSGPEGNDSLKAIGRFWRRIARRCRTACILIHHTKKGASGLNAGDMDAARFGGPLHGRIRVGLTLFPMTEDEAKAQGIPPARRHRFVRLDDGKQSYAARDDAKWFEIDEVRLPVSEEKDVAVGVFRPVFLKTAFDALSNPIIHTILRDVDDAADRGDPFQPTASGRKWVGTAILARAPDTSREHATEVVRKWLHNGLLTRFTFDHPGQRKERTGVRSDITKWPGTTSG